MRIYLAVIADSFHSAFSSRVLWIALIAIWILLGALALVGYREDYTTDFVVWRDMRNGTQLKLLLADGLKDEAQGTAVSKISAAMPDDLKGQLQQIADGQDIRIRTDRLTRAMNGLLDDKTWYDADAWEPTLRLRELRELDETPDDDLSESLKRRRARLRLEAAMPGVFPARSARSIKLTYAGLDFPAEFAIDKAQFSTLVNQFVVPTLVNWMLGFVLIFLGILVTAS
ncbi:MAG: ABC transporter permease, partial [Planctomycetota bacterium]